MGWPNITLETIINGIYTIFFIFNLIFCCLANLRANPMAETSDVLSTRLYAEPNFEYARLILLLKQL